MRHLPPTPKPPRRIVSPPADILQAAPGSLGVAKADGIPGLPVAKTAGWWSRIGAGSLMFAVLFHVILLIIAAFWIFKIVQPVEKKVDFMPTGGGGGDPSTVSVSQEKQRVHMVRTVTPRVAAKDMVGALTLPEPEAASEMAPLSNPDSGALSGGLGGSGSGGGKGSGTGRGFGSGSGPGRGLGAAAVSPFGMNPFGANDPGIAAWEGTFYDLKLSRSGVKGHIGDGELARVISDFTTRGWKEASLDRYYAAKQKLYQTRIYIPSMPADRAPAAFNCGPEVKPSNWLVVYRGVVTPPKTGTYRFAGAGDDILVVRFGGKNVLDHGFISGTSEFAIGGAIPFLKGEREDADLQRITRRDYPMKPPVSYYTYGTTTNWNRNIGGIALGVEFEAVTGTSYPIEILISESGGNLFCASLLIEEKGMTYSKDPGGAPILPLFRLDGSVPPPSDADNSPPFDPQGPVWKVVPGNRKIEIDL